MISPDFGTEVCRALGLDPIMVTSINIHISAGLQPPLVRVTMYPGALDNRADKLIEVIKKYDLVEKGKNE